MAQEINPGQPTPVRRRPAPQLTPSKPGTTPSTTTILAILGGCLFAVLMVIGVTVLGFVFYFQQQKALEAQKVARLEEQRAASARAVQEARATQAAARQEQIERQRREEEKIALEQQERRVELQRQSRMKAEKRKSEEVAARGLSQIQATLFNHIQKAAPEDLIAPGPVEESGLSWRVHLLPALGLQSLHNEFHLDEPWDSKHNSQLVSKMPPIFGTDSQTGMTQIRSFLRLDGAGGGHTRIGDVLDGLEQTALLFRVGENQAIPWTQPDNGQLFTPVTLERLGITDEEVLQFTLCGLPNVRHVSSMPPDVLQAMCSPGGGEHLYDELLAGQIKGPAVAVWVASLETEAKPKGDTPWSKEQESRQAHEKLKQISQAFAKRDKQLQTMPESAAARPSPLSWRVHLLPFLGEDKLYAKFDLSQRWNSEANLPLASQMPDVFQLGSYGGRTRFILSLPEDCRRAVGQLPAGGVITDDPELTTLLYLAAPQRGVTWTQPDAMTAIRGTLQQSFGWAESTAVIAATFAGTTIELPGNLHPSKLLALTSTHRGETFDLSLALANPEQQLRLTPSLKPAKPIADLIRLPKLSVDPATLKSAALPTDASRFQKLNVAIYRFNDEFRQSPTNVQAPGGVRSQLSWRVHLLPFLDQKPLYDRFKLDEPWDSEHNHALLEFMPEIFQTSSDAISTTRLRVLSGKGSLFAAGQRWMQPPDGILNTIMVLETGDPFEQEWTKPDTEIEISSLDYPGLFGNAKEVKALLGSGQLLRFTADAPSAIFRALATADGREILDAQTVQRWLAHQRGESLIPPQAESRWQSDQMQSIAFAAIAHHDVYHFYPPQQSKNAADGIPLRSSQLSWRVHLLPLLGHATLYKQFRLEEPWDSPHNQQLLASMPDCYRDADDLADSHKTRIVRIMGPGTPFPEPGLAPAMRDIRDGSSQTLHFIQAPAEDAVAWTQPEDLAVNLNDASSLELLTRLTATPALKTVTFDGAVRSLAPNIDVEMLLGLITPAGGEVLKTRELFLEN